MANIDLGNLTRYDGKIKQYVEDKYLSKNTANWQMTEKAGAVTCYPVPDTELEPIVDFSFKEIPPASGDKSPSNPSTIEGISSITLTRCGKNVMPFPYAETSHEEGNIVWTVNSDQTITANGTASGNSFFDLYSANSGIIKPNLSYALSGCPLNGSASTYYMRFGGGSATDDYGNGKVFISDSFHESANLILRVQKGITINNLLFKPQLELNNVITNYEKYQGNSYVYSLNNTYYGGSVNLATGMMTVTWYGIILTGEETVTEEVMLTEGVHQYSIAVPYYCINDLAVQTCTHFDAGTYIAGANHFYVRSTAGSAVRFFSDSITNAQSFEDFLVAQYNNSTPVVFCYKLATPYTVQLTPIQIKSLFALDKNTPRLNTLYTDADSIQVGYQKHPARTAYELENAILALGGGE